MLIDAAGLVAIGARLPALAAFNVITLEYAEGIVAGAERTGLPVLLGVSHNAVRFHGGLAAIAAGCRALAEAVAVPVGLHLDHCEDADLVLACAHEGFASAMFDGSTLPYEQNVAETARVVAAGHDAGLWIEAELGEIGGKDGAHAPGVRTDPAEAVAFVAATGVDALAVAVGTSHAMTTRTAEPDLALIARLAAAVPVPLVLHGSSGVDDPGLRDAVAAGIRKVNVGTQLSAAYSRALRERLGPGPDPRAALTAARAAIADTVARLLPVISDPATTKGTAMPLATEPEPVTGSLTLAEYVEAGDIMAALRACHERRLEREGIPMLLGLTDERGAIPANTDARQRAEGDRYADLFDRYRESLVPWAREDDEDAVITAMQVVAYSHFAPDASAVSLEEEVSA